MHHRSAHHLSIERNSEATVGEISKVYPDPENGTLMLTVHANLTLVLEIAFVSNEHHRKVILVLDPEDLLMELVDFLERLSSGYRVNEDEPFSGAHVLFAHRSIGEKGDIR